MASSENSPFQWLIEEIGARLSQAISSMTGEEISSTCSAASGTPVAQLWWEQPLSFPPGAAIFLGGANDYIVALGGRILQAAGVPADDETVRSTYFETLAQGMSATARTLSGRFGREVNCGPGKEIKQLPADTEGLFRVEIRAGENRVGEVHVCLGRAFRSLVRSTTSGGPPADSVSQVAAPVAVAPTHMDVLYDVELPVSVSFGRAQLALRDVINLTTGSIVELNRSVTEPVEVIVNNCVIARGEVVVVEGNYGVRIDQIITRQERLRTVK
jgi:flagellar motor switch protein FliN/FliY